MQSSWGLQNRVKPCLRCIVKKIKIKTLRRTFALGTKKKHFSNVHKLLKKMYLLLVGNCIDCVFVLMRFLLSCVGSFDLGREFFFYFFKKVDIR